MCVHVCMCVHMHVCTCACTECARMYVCVCVHLDYIKILHTHVHRCQHCAFFSDLEMGHQSHNKVAMPSSQLLSITINVGKGLASCVVTDMLTLHQVNIRGCGILFIHRISSRR